jgi:hypothetical protein
VVLEMSDGKRPPEEPIAVAGKLIERDSVRPLNK